MGIEENKRIVLKLMESMEGEPDYSLVAEDAQWVIPGLGRIGFKEFREILQRLGPRLATPVRLTVDHITAEDDRVAVEARGHARTSDGRDYDNTYHFLFFLRDGKVIEQHEHTDTAYAHSILGVGLTEGIAAS